VPNFPGFIGEIGVTVPIGATYVYRLNFFTGFIAASSIYYLLCKFYPIPATSDHWLELDDEAQGGDSLVLGVDAGSDVEHGYTETVHGKMDDYKK
jgi:NCS1 family nucleobase:cation symporter-1